MSETLNGRLKCEHTDDGIRVVIPDRLSWGAVRKLLEELCVVVLGSLSIIAAAGFVAYLLRGSSSLRSFLMSEGVNGLFLSSLGYCAGLILLRMVARVFGKTVLTLGQAEMTIEWNSRIRRSRDEFPAAALHSFHFVERSGDTPVQNKIGQNEIQFGDADSTRHFGEGVTREEAEALIAKIAEVYPIWRNRHEKNRSSG